VPKSQKLNQVCRYLCYFTAFAWSIIMVGGVGGE